MVGKDEELILSDGRRLGYSEYGDPNGSPVFYFHGSPSSRLEPLMFGDAFATKGLHLVAPDRPGIGRSDWQTSRSFTDWVLDIQHLADHLGWKQFALFGNSGGGAYVVACAALLKKRTTVAVVVSGAWRMDAPEVKANLPFVNRMFWILAKRFPPGLRLMLHAMKESAPADKPESDGKSDGSSENEIKRLEAMLPPPDVAALLAPGRMKAVSAGIAEALRQGTRGAAWDARMYVRPFGFDHSTIDVPFRAFHGALDRNVPLALVKRYVAEIPGATLQIWPDDGHLSAPCNHMDEIVEALKN